MNLNLFKKRRSFESSFLSRGFSLVEMLVVVAIFLVLTAVLLGNQSKFSSDILITNLAYKIALSIREAQIYGLGGKQVDNIKYAYGIHFSSSASSDDKSYDLVSDSPRYTTGSYNFNFDTDSTPSDGKDNILVPQGQRIRGFCATPKGGTEECSSGLEVSGSVLTYVNIFFLKPDPDAIINTSQYPYDYEGSPSYGDKYHYSETCIVVESSLGDKTRTIRVSSAGQISVDPVGSGKRCGSTTS